MLQLTINFLRQGHFMKTRLMLACLLLFWCTGVMAAVGQTPPNSPLSVEEDTRRWEEEQLTAYFLECGTKREIEVMQEAYNGVCAEGLAVYSAGQLIYREKYKGPTLVEIVHKNGNAYIAFPDPVSTESFQQ